MPAPRRVQKIAPKTLITRLFERDDTIKTDEAFRFAAETPFGAIQRAWRGPSTSPA
jgi:hypothetical protein